MTKVWEDGSFIFAEDCERWDSKADQEQIKAIDGKIEQLKEEVGEIEGGLTEEELDEINRKIDSKADKEELESKADKTEVEAVRMLDTSLRAEVVSSLPKSAKEGQLVFQTNVGFFGRRGGKWVRLDEDVVGEEVYKKIIVEEFRKKNVGMKIYDIEVTEDFVFVGGDSGKIVKLNKENLDIITSVTVAGTTVHNLVAFKGFLFVGTYLGDVGLMKYTYDLKKVASNEEVARVSTGLCATKNNLYYHLTELRRNSIFRLDENLKILSENENGDTLGGYINFANENHVYTCGYSRLNNLTFGKVLIGNDGTFPTKTITNTKSADIFADEESIYITTENKSIEKYVKNGTEWEKVAEVFYGGTITSITGDKESIYVGGGIGRLKQYDHFLKLQTEATLGTWIYVLQADGDAVFGGDGVNEVTKNLVNLYERG